MPSPIAHSLMGYLIYRVTTRSFTWRKWYIILLYLFVACVPDLDFIPGLLIGSVNRYHHGASHSIGFSLLFAFGCYIVLRLLKREDIKRSVTIYFGLYFSHIVLDYLTKVPDRPYGELLLWPFSNEYYIAPFAFFPVIQFNGGSTGEFFCSLLSLHNFSAMSVEFAFLAPLVLTVELWKCRRK